MPPAVLSTLDTRCVLTYRTVWLGLGHPVNCVTAAGVFLHAHLRVPYRCGMPRWCAGSGSPYCNPWLIAALNGHGLVGLPPCPNLTVEPAGTRGRIYFWLRCYHTSSLRTGLIVQLPSVRPLTLCRRAGRSWRTHTLPYLPMQRRRAAVIAHNGTCWFVGTPRPVVPQKRLPPSFAQRAQRVAVS